MDRRFTFPALCIVIALSVALAISHRFFLAGTETDFLNAYLPDANNIISGKPLRIESQPPLYPFVLAALHLFVRDWLVEGRLISVISFCLVALINLRLFAKAVGPAAAAGVILAFACCTASLLFSTLATGDMFFLLLYSGALLTAIEAASRPTSMSWHFLTGALVGLAVLSRANGVVLLPLLALPFFVSEDGKRLTHPAVGVIGCFVPIGAWVAYARMSHSPFYPSQHVNLAMTYFSDGADRQSADTYAVLDQRFHSAWDVLRLNPGHIALIYARDLCASIFKNVVLLAPVVGLLGVLGIDDLIRRPRKSFIIVILCVTALHVLLINFKTHEFRYYIFLVPVLGAAAGCFLQNAVTRLWPASGSLMLPRTMAVLFCIGLTLTGVFAANKLHPPFERELRDALVKTRGIVTPGSIIYARKPPLAYYLNSEFRMLPIAKDPEALRQNLATVNDRETFLYFGNEELARRPQLLALAQPDHVPSWLKLRAHGEGPRWMWSLYQLERQQ